MEMIKDRGPINYREQKNKIQILENYSNARESDEDSFGEIDLIRENNYEGALDEIDIIGVNNYYEDLEFGFEKRFRSFGFNNDDYKGIKKSLTGNYFIVFAKENFPNTTDQLKASLSIFKEEKKIITENIDKIPIEEFFQGNSFCYFQNLGIVFTDLTDEQVNKVGNQKNFFFVEPERIVEAVGNTNSSGTHKTPLNNRDTWGIDYIINGQIQNYTGKGVNVAVIDSGYDHTHPDYQNRVVPTKTYLGNTADDLYGHGMHCTGIAFGYEDVANNIRYGLAYGANIHSARILNSKGYGVMSDIILALDWAVKKDCKVALLSVGISNNGLGLPTSVMHRAIEQARQNHCIVVAAAGNDSRRSIKQIKPLASPADAQLSISVGAIDSKNNIYNNCNRAEPNYGQFMNYVAPGLDIYSSWSQLSRTNPVTHFHMSGTSMAAPYIAGIIALLWEKYPNALSQKILFQLRYKCFKDSRWSNIWDFGNGVPRLP